MPDTAECRSFWAKYLKNKTKMIETIRMEFSCWFSFEASFLFSSVCSVLWLYPACAQSCHFQFEIGIKSQYPLLNMALSPCPIDLVEIEH